MFVTTQPWQKDENYAILMQDLKPPPPPGDESVWELHFCKWWGWNWVRRKEAAEMPMQKRIEAQLQNAPNEPDARKTQDMKKTEMKKPEKKPEKKPIKNLCRTLCFKSKKQQKPLQKMYNTPSNSVIEDRDAKMEKSIVTIQNLNSQPSRERAENFNSTIHREIEELVIKEIRNQVYAPPKEQSRRKKKVRKEWSSSSSDECSCCCCGDRSESSREGSVEYINISCCPCCHPKEPPVNKKRMSENCTQPSLPRCKMISTQTEEKEKKRRRRRICVVCCSCGQSVRRCCSCNKNGVEEEKIEKSRNHHHSLEAAPGASGTKQRQYNKETTKNHNGLPNMYSPAYNVITEHSSPFAEKILEPSTLKKKFEPLYKTGMPLEMMLFNDCNKPITKFGMPSQNYSWIHATKSDIWDQLSHLKMSREFSSPVSGNIYNISPIKVRNVGPEPSVLLNLLSVDEELQSLKKIESEVKMDLKSRIMLDAVCDAILSKDKELSDKSSILLNELTYPSNITQTESITNNLHKSKKKHSNSKSNQTQALDEKIFEDVIKECGRNRNVNSENSVELNSSLTSQENKSFSELVKVRSPRTYSIENPCIRVTPNPRISLNYKSYQDSFKTAIEKNTPDKQTDFVIKDNPSSRSVVGQTLSRTGLMSAYKRSASPTPGQNIKKAKLKGPTSLRPLDNRNITDIFKKIDEIVLRSKVNNEEIQNVLKAIPKRTFQFFTSWEVSNVTNQNSPVHITEPEEVSTSSMNTVIEETENQDRTKMQDFKKNKTAGRPSLIPKRVSNAKLNKQ